MCASGTIHRCSRRLSILRSIEEPVGARQSAHRHYLLDRKVECGNFLLRDEGDLLRHLFGSEIAQRMLTEDDGA